MMNRIPVFYDCDPGHDDAIAIVLAVSNPRINLLGISTVHGNHTVENTCSNALRMLQVCNVRNIPVVKGSSAPLLRPSKIAQDIHGKTGLDMEGCSFPPLNMKQKPDNAIVFMFETIKKHYTETNEKVHLVGTACMTNIALLLSTFPSTYNYLHQIVVLGGSIGLGNVTPKSEFNFYLDPEAASIVFSQKRVQVVQIPVEVTHTNLVTPVRFQRIESLSSNFSKLITGILSFFKTAYKSKFGFDHPPLHDPLAIFYVLHPECFTSRRMNVVIETKSKFCDGATVIDVHGVSKREKNVMVCNKVDCDRFWEVMITAIRKADSVSPINTMKKKNVQDEPNITSKKRKRDEIQIGMNICEEEKPLKKQKLD